MFVVTHSNHNDIKFASFCQKIHLHLYGNIKTNIRVNFSANAFWIKTM